jgi:hypothetical protein
MRSAAVGELLWATARRGHCGEELAAARGELATTMAVMGRRGDRVGWEQQQVLLYVARVCFGCSRGF